MIKTTDQVEYTGQSMYSDRSKKPKTKPRISRHKSHGGPNEEKQNKVYYLNIHEHSCFKCIWDTRHSNTFLLRSVIIFPQLIVLKHQLSLCLNYIAESCCTGPGHTTRTALNQG